MGNVIDGTTYTDPKPLTQQQQDQALQIVADWMRPHLGEWIACTECEPCLAGSSAYSCENPSFGPVPTGTEAARQGLGPMLIPDWDWPRVPTPTVLLEGGPEDWAIRVADERSDAFAAIGVFAEPYASYALCLYSAA